MVAERTLRVLVLLAVAEGCTSSENSGSDAMPDAEQIMFQPFTSRTWSLAMMGGAAQLSITGGGGAAACALSEDQRRSLGAAGVQIILRLPGTVTGTCPAGSFTMARCAASLGSEAYVPAGCAFYRAWDAQGTSLGIAAAINGEITIAGDATSCSIRANVGFLGGSFAETFTLMNGATAQPWCREG